MSTSLNGVIEEAARNAVLKVLEELLQTRLPEPEYLSTEQAAALIGFSTQQLEIWRHQKKGPPYVKLKRAVRYGRSSLMAWMQQHERSPE